MYPVTMQKGSDIEWHVGMGQAMQRQSPQPPLRQLQQQDSMTTQRRPAPCQPSCSSLPQTGRPAGSGWPSSWRHARTAGRPTPPSQRCSPTAASASSASSARSPCLRWCVAFADGPVLLMATTLEPAHLLYTAAIMDASFPLDAAIGIPPFSCLISAHCHTGYGCMPAVRRPVLLRSGIRRVVMTSLRACV